METRILVSQRWPTRFISKVEEHIAWREQTGKDKLKKTALTIQALELLMAIDRKYGTIDVKTIIDAMNVTHEDPVITGETESELIIDRMLAFLQANPGKKFDTNELVQALRIPQITARKYMSRLADENDMISIIKGRPKKVVYLC